MFVYCTWCHFYYRLYGRLYKITKDGGTLVQLRNLTRRTLPHNFKSDVNISDDFVDLVLCSVQSRYDDTARYQRNR